MTELTSVRLKSFNNASFQHCVTSQQIRELELSQDCALINSALFKESHKKKVYTRSKCSFISWCGGDAGCGQ